MAETWKTIQGWMTPDECGWIAQQARQARVIVEVGVWRGRSTVCWLENTSGVVYAVDAWPADGCGCQAYEELRQKGREAIRNDALKNLAPWLASGRCFLLEMRSNEAARVLQDLLQFRGADLVFIDGGHDLLTVADDIRNYLPLVRPGGLLSGHDYDEVRAGIDSVALRVEVDRPRAGSIWWHRVEEVG